MKIFLKYCLPAIISFILVSCKNTEKAVTGDEPEVKSTYTMNELASGEAKIIGKIISIDDTRESEGPCAKAACRAKIIIQNLEKKGSLFQLNNIKDTIPVSFAFTLAPTTADLFPGMKTIYPGLKINDRFEAKIESRLAMNEQGVSYIIYHYRPLKKQVRYFKTEK